MMLDPDIKDAFKVIGVIIVGIVSIAVVLSATIDYVQVKRAGFFCKKAYCYESNETCLEEERKWIERCIRNKLTKEVK